MEWHPWDDVKNNKLGLPKLTISSITEPPCKNCKYFSPQIITYPTIEGQVFDSVRCCWADEQYNDFSCYERVIL